MFFRNATMLRFGEEIAKHAVLLDGRFAANGLRDPGPLEIATAGFVPVFKIGVDQYFAQFGGDSVLFCVGFRTRMLPNDVVQDETNRRVDAILAGGVVVGHKHRKLIKEEVISELLPQAFVRQTRVHAYMDLAAGWLVINTASAKVADHVRSQIREALSSFKCTSLTPEVSPRQIMTDWLMHDRAPGDIAIGDECDLADPAEGGSKWNGRRADLETDEVREHLRSGMQVFRLGLTYAERLSFVLGEDLVIRKLRFLDSALEDLGEPEDAQAELDARFTLMRLEFERLFAIMSKTFGIPREGKLVLDGGDAPKSMRVAVRGLDRLAHEDGVTATLEHDDKTIATFGDGPDPLIAEATVHVRVHGRVSISNIQRTFKLGYNRAARIVETLEAAGVVSAPSMSGVRTVLPA